MASLGTSFSFGSAVSATGSAFSDAFESYRRTQYLVAGSNVAPTSETEEDEEEETGFRRGPLYDSDEEEAEDLIPGPASSRHRQDSFVANLDWDEEGEGEPSQTDLSFSPTSRPRLSGRRFDTGATVQQPTVARPGEVKPPMHEAPRNESSPLLSRKSSSVQEYFSVEDSAAKSYGTESHDPNLLSPPAPTLRRRSSAASHKSKLQQYSFGGRSTYGQSLFNSIAILLGIGMLSEPLAFAYAGWGMGTVLIITYAMISCYTAKILARVILSDPRLRSYADIGRKAFGPKATVFISAMFCLELFAVTVVLVTLYADSLHSLIPTYSPTVYKIMGLAIFIPTVFLPLSLLSYTSILGILSTVILVFVIFVDGFSKTSAPGSLWEPASTTFGVQSFNKLGLAFGLFMAGFSGHPVIPSLARDMADPSQFDHMINWAFTIATFIYTAIGAAGYLMFGDAVHDEISIDLLNTPGYPPALNYICLWLLVISPLSKFGLNTQPLTTTIDVFLGLDTPSFASPEDLAAKPGRLSISRHGLKRALAVMQRICITLLSVGVSILIPEFSSMMAFLGSFSAFMLAVVGPVLANIALTGRCSLVDGSIVFMGIVMALWGTAAAFYAAA